MGSVIAFIHLFIQFQNPTRPAPKWHFNNKGHAGCPISRECNTNKIFCDSTGIRMKIFTDTRWQWQFHSSQVTWAGDTCGARGKFMGGEKLVPPPNHWALDWFVVLTVGGLCPIAPQDNIVASNKHNWPEFYQGNAQACPDLTPVYGWGFLELNSNIVLHQER